MTQNIFQQELKVSRKEREQHLDQRSVVIWFTGLSGSGKSTLANELEKKLIEQGFSSYLLDGDNIRFGLNNNLSFTAEDRKENLRRTAEVAKLFLDAGIITICCFISPLNEDRKMVRDLIGADDFVEVYVSTPLDVCEQRDVKGLYRKARNGEIHNFTGISAPYETPDSAQVVIDTSREELSFSIDNLIETIKPLVSVFQQA